MKSGILTKSKLLVRGLFLFLFLILFQENIAAQGVVFKRDISPAEGMVKPQEKPYRQEICLNGSWDFQPVAVPKDWKPGNGVPSELTAPVADKWEQSKIKIPSPWNVNGWGGGSKVGKGTNSPYSPSSVYYPGYPQSWENVRMGWLRRNFDVPEAWKGEKIILHFEAVMGEFVVVVNGHTVAQHFGAYMPFDVDITDFVKTDLPNELMVGVRHRRLFDKTSEKYKYFRSTYPPGSNTDNLAGIWQDVFLWAVPPVRITNIFVKPWVDKDELEFEVEMVNQAQKSQTVSLSGTISEWLNQAGKDVLSAPEIKWVSGKNVLELSANELTLKPGESKKMTLKTRVQGNLKLWSPGNPNLYTVQLQLKEKKKTVDCKTERFGWRQFTIKDKDFLLNGNRIQCFADIQHPFGAYICSRRFAWAWFKMIQDFGGNCVRLHAQPWPRLYYDLADEMGLMVLDEGALFGSSLSLNFEEEITWKRTAEHLDALVMRDRNHPSVIGWSAGNELFAIPMYNKPEPGLAKIWDAKIIELAKRPALLDPTKAFITDDGDEDMHGNLAVWSKHFGHGLTLDRLPKDMNKPLVVGESGATYYGKPKDLYQFVGEKAYESYYGRSEALAIDVYQNVVKMARPMLSYFSPSEVCWFGIEHMNLGYHDYSRLPDPNDGIFAGKPYEEGKPGYQIERIPPYVSTFNPGLDPDLPLYKPLPMFEALQAALSDKEPLPCKWDHYQPQAEAAKPPFPASIYEEAYFVGNTESELAKQLITFGIKLTSDEKIAKLVVVDGENVTEEQLKKAGKIIDRVKTGGGLIWVMISIGEISPALNSLLPAQLELTDRQSTSLKCNPESEFAKYFELPGLYFSEMDGDRKILKHGLAGELVKQGTVVLEATNVDWSLFNQAGENRKCAQVVLYEHLQKPSGVALVKLPSGNAQLWVSTIDYKISTVMTKEFWKNLLAAMRMQVDNGIDSKNSSGKKEHNLLLDGPVGN
jgi:beta-galactosidase